MPRLVFFLLIVGLLAAQITPNPTADSGWAIDPDGSTSSSEERPDSGWAIDPNG